MNTIIYSYKLENVNIWVSIFTSRVKVSDSANYFLPKALTKLLPTLRSLSMDCSLILSSQEERSPTPLGKSRAGATPLYTWLNKQSSFTH